MNTMTPTASFNQFVDTAQKDFSLLIAAQVKKFAYWWLGILLIALLGIPYLIFAQIAPYFFRKHLNIILPFLPDIKDPQMLSKINDAFMIYYWALKGYKPVCLFRKSLDSLLDELDEQMDSISFVLAHQSSLQQTIEKLPN